MLFVLLSLVLTDVRVGSLPLINNPADIGKVVGVTGGKYGLKFGDQCANPVDYGADPTGATDSLAAFNAAEAAMSVVCIPEGSFRLSGTWVIDHTVIVRGVGYRSGGTFLTAPPGSDGIRTEYFSGHRSVLQGFSLAPTYGAPTWLPNQVGFTVGYTNVAPAWSGFALVVQSGTRTGPTEPVWPTTEGATVTETGVVDPVTWVMKEISGIRIEATATIRDVSVSSWPGNGIAVIAGIPDTNANGTYVENNLSALNSAWGFYARGTDANGGTYINNVAIVNGSSTAAVDAGGFYDHSALGNTYVGNTSEGNQGLEDWAYLVPVDSPSNNSNASMFYGNYCEGGQVISINNFGLWHGESRGCTPRGYAQIMTPFRANTIIFQNDDNDDGTGPEITMTMGFTASSTNIMEIDYSEDQSGGFPIRHVFQNNLINGGARTGVMAWNYYGSPTRSAWGFTNNLETTYGGGRMWIPRDFMIGAPSSESMIGTRFTYPGHALFSATDSRPPGGSYFYGTFFKEYAPQLGGGFLGYLNLATGPTGTWGPVAKARISRVSATSTTLENYDWYLGISSTAAVRTVTLPRITANYGSRADMDTLEFLIKDESGAASAVNYIQLAPDPAGTDLIDGVNANKTIISSAYGSAHVIRRDGKWWTYAMGGGAGGGTGGTGATGAAGATGPTGPAWTTSAEARASISDETGTGAMCFATAPTLIGPITVDPGPNPYSGTLLDLDNTGTPGGSAIEAFGYGYAIGGYGKSSGDIGVMGWGAGSGAGVKGIAGAGGSGVAMLADGGTFNGIGLRGVGGASGGAGVLGVAGGTGLTAIESTGNLKITGQAYNVLPSTVTTAGTTATIDWNNGNGQVFDAQGSSGNVTFTFSNPIAGASYVLKLIQGSSARTYLWPATVKWPGGTAPTVTATNDAIDLCSFFCDGTNYIGSCTLDHQ
jgi:hypothetical protein